MRYLISVFAGILVIVFIGWTTLPPAGAAPTLDQSCCAGSSNGFAAFGELTRAQTFTVGLSGQLTEVDVLLELFDSGSVQFDIVPGFSKGATLGSIGAPVASQTLSWTTSSSGFFALDLSAANLFVTVGENLAVVQRPTPSTGNWDDFQNNLYPGGAALTTSFNPDLITVNDTFIDLTPEDFPPDFLDFGFKTWVDPAAIPPVPEPATMLLLGSGLLGLWGFRKKFMK